MTGVTSAASFVQRSSSVVDFVLTRWLRWRLDLKHVYRYGNSHRRKFDE